MDVQVADINARIGRMMGVAPISRWVVQDTADGAFTNDAEDERSALAMISAICEKTGRPENEFRAIKDGSMARLFRCLFA